MRILVTGGAGFIGSNLVEELVKNDYEVSVLDNFFLGKKENLSTVLDKIKLIKGDVRDEKIVNKATIDVDFIFHQAAASSSPMFRDDIRNAISVNIDGFINILNAARKNGVKRVIYASSSTVYGNSPIPLKEDMQVTPPNFYAVTKLAEEHLANIFYQEYGLEGVGLRYMSVYGPHEEGKGEFANLVSQFLWAMLNNEQPIIYGDGTQTRDFVFVKDVVSANLLAMNAKLGHEVINVGNGKATSLNDMVAILNRILGKNIKPKYITIPVKNYMMAQLADLTKAKKILGYEPSVSLEEGVKLLLMSEK